MVCMENLRGSGWSSGSQMRFCRLVVFFNNMTPGRLKHLGPHVSPCPPESLSEDQYSTALANSENDGKIEEITHVKRRGTFFAILASKR